MAKRTLRVERLAKKEERKIVRRIVSLSVVSAIIAVFLFTLGVSILGNFADFLGAIFRKSEQTTNQSAPSAPRIENLPVATNSARLAVNGFSSGSTSVAIYLNGAKVGKVDVLDGKFKYDDVSLDKGENKIEAKALNSSGDESDFSSAWVVIFDKEEPKLEIEGPQEGQFFFGNNRIKVFGSSEADAQVFANGFLASVNSEGKFEVFLSLLEGENTIEIKAVDPAGNTKTETRKVTFRK